MKFNAKLLILLIAGLLILSACGTSTDDNTNTSGNNAEESNNANDEAGEQTTEDVVLQVGTDAAFAPFEYLDKGEIVGFDADILEAVMAEAGYEYEFTNVGWDPMMVSTQNGDLDFAIAGITVDEERVETYDFSVPYFESTHMIVFNEGTDITSANDLEGLKIGVQTGTTGAIAAEKVVGEKNPNILKFDTTTGAFMELTQGNVEAVVTDNVVAQEFVKNNPDAGVETITDQENFESEYYGIMFPKGSELVDEINTALTAIIENGTYAEIYQEWFGKEPDVEQLLNAAE